MTTTRHLEPQPATPSETKSALMTIDQAAEYLATPTATLYTWRTRRPGFGPRAVKIGGSLRYRRSDLDEWIERHTEGPVINGDDAASVDRSGSHGLIR